jgi:hypothetical protein
MLVEKIFASLLLAACLVALLRMALRPRQRDRFDAFWRRAWQRAKAPFQRRKRPPLSAQQARRAAEEAIERARRKGDGRWEGNVFRPRSFFKRPRKPH